MKIRVPDALILAKHYHGTSLHIVLDDGNIDDHHVEFCIEEAVSKGDKQGENLARIILSLSRRQRASLYKQL